MMRKKALALGIAALVSLSGCARTAQQQADARALTDQTVQSVNWFQTSGEYRALAWQAFNAARLSWDAAPKARGEKYAVIVDLDETMLDNSSYSAWQIKQRRAFDDKSWSRWVRSGQALAVPGAVDFANYVAGHGGTVFYVSNRDAADADATAQNMRRLGFPQVGAATLRLKTDGSNKQQRFDQIAAEGYRVVMFIGDNLNDYGEATYHKTADQRRRFADDNRAAFGTRFIVLPNPMYGDWEGALAPGYYKLTPQQQAQVQRETLRAWGGE